MSITVTERAAEHIRKTLVQRENAVGLRLGVREQGCTGFAYVIEVAQAIQPSDQVHEAFGVKVLIDETSLPILKGTQVDYVVKGLNRSFEFNNPNAEHYCGCGESFNLKTTETNKMAIERTLSIIKPDAVAKNVIGEIYTRFEKNGLTIVAAKMMQLTREQAEDFYAVHKARPFFNALVSFMISGPVIIQVLEGDNAVIKNRDLMGATNPKEAVPGTIRADFADSIDANAVHGSDSAENARTEIAFFFDEQEIVPR